MSALARMAACALLAGSAGWSASVRQLEVGSSAGEDSCVLTSRGTQFPATTRQVFARIVVAGLRYSDLLRVDFVNPSGLVVSSVPYDQLPPTPSLCLLAQLPVAGFPAAQSPGAWTVRVSLNGVPAQSAAFVIEADEAAVKGLRIGRITLEDAGGRTRVVLDGTGFNTESILHVAQYEKEGGWKYLTHSFPETLAPTRAAVSVGALQPGEYVVFVKNGNLLSAPARFLITTTGGYRLPFPPQEQWVISQPPYGGYSHWGSTLHAYDIAPRSGGCVVAMRAGIAHTGDLGFGQTPNLRIFGNYISIEHEDGEFSHYGHLRTRSFRVQEGQRVEQGQPLAIAGNSGYSFGTHVHVQVTRGSSISSPSIPFRFQDLPPQQQNGYRGPVVATSRTNFPDCAGSKVDSSPVFTQSVASSKALKTTTEPDFTGSVAVAGWWNQFLPVPAGASHLEVRLDWDASDRDLDLHLVSPSGHHFGSSYGDRAGFAARATEESFRIPNPESGTWRVSVQGIRGNGETIPFRIYRQVQTAQPGVAAGWGGARRR